MTPMTRRQYGRLLKRFVTHRVAYPDGTIEEGVRAFLGTLTESVAHTGYLALKAALPEAAWRTIPAPRPRRNEARLLATLYSREELTAARAAAEAPRERAVLELAWTLRRVELTRIRWADVDLTTGTIRVVRKGGRETWTLLIPAAQMALAKWYVALGQPDDATPVFPGRAGAMTPGHIGKIYRAVLRRARIYKPWRGLHAARRSLATRYLNENPGDLDGLARLLGHQKLDTTRLYSWPTPDDLRPRLAKVRL